MIWLKFLKSLPLKWWFYSMPSLCLVSFKKDCSSHDLNSIEIGMLLREHLKLS